MFSIDSQPRGTFDLLWEDRRILSGCSPTVTLHDGSTSTWDEDAFQFAREQAETADVAVYRFAYFNAECKIRLELMFECTAESVRAFAHVSIPTSFSSRPLYLDPERSVQLTASVVDASEGLLAHRNTYRWWTGPVIAERDSEIPADTQALLWKSEATYVQAMAGVSDRFVSSMLGDETGLVFQASTLQSGCCSGKACLWVMAAHRDPFEASRLAAKEGIRATGGYLLPKEERSYPEMLEYLGFCSWDAFNRNVNADGLIAKAEEFRSKNVPVRWFIIDEGWLEADEQDRLVSFRADPVKFPDGLQALASKLKTEQGLSWVGVWHTITGFWNGIQPNGSLAKDMANSLLMTSGGRLIPQPDAVRGFAFWNEWHAKLRREGVDFVKVDSQSTLYEYVKHDVPVGSASRGAHTSLEASVGLHFGMRMINCMGMRPESIFSRVRSAVSRNSDDFTPRQEHSFRAFAVMNVYNSLYHGQLYWGDWDMWWSDHPYALQNAFLRAVSGGPVYVSDAPGGTNADTLLPLVLSDGKVLRCDGSGMPTADIIFRNPIREPIPLKAQNRSGEAGIVGAWNVNETGARAIGTLCADDVPGLEGERFAIWSRLSGTVSILGRSEQVQIALDGQDCELYVIAPVRAGIAVFGLTEKFVSPASVAMRIDDNVKTTLLLKEGGVLGFASEQAPASVRVGGVEQALEIKNGMYTVPVPDGRSLVEIVR